MRKKKKAPVGRAANWMRRRGLLVAKYRFKRKEAHMSTETKVVAFTQASTPTGKTLTLLKLEERATKLRLELGSVERRIALQKRIINSKK